MMTNPQDKLGFKTPPELLVCMILLVGLFFIERVPGLANKFTLFLTCVVTIYANGRLLMMALRVKDPINGQGMFALFLLTVGGSWMLIWSFSRIYAIDGILGADKKLTHDMADCLYFSVVTWTTLGYGDFQPVPSNRMFAAIEAFTGYIYMAFAIGFVIHFLTKDNAADREKVESANRDERESIKME